MIREISSELLCKMIISAAANLANHRQEVDNMNVFPVPDGDTGTNMSMTMDACFNAVGECADEDNVKITKAVANAALRGARGNSGVILSQLLRGVQKSVANGGVFDCKAVSAAVQNAAKTAYKAVMKPTEGTILTVAREMAECAAKYENDFDNVADFAAVIVKAGNDALKHTPDMLPQLKQAGVVDSGGQGLMYIAEGFLYVLQNGECIERKDSSAIAAGTAAAKTEITDLKYQYCTECIIENKNKNADAFAFKMKLEPKGDSMVIVDDDEVIKVHIHTNNPDFVLNEALKLGELYTVKIENMKLQHNNLISPSKNAEKSDAKSQPENAKKYGFICVAAGEGLEETFKKLGVDCIIKGGQTMNPSTDDILHSIEELNAENIYVFPNNKNIIMASEQAKQLSDKNVYVVPTTSITQAMSCLLTFDDEVSPDDNFDVMRDAVCDVKSAQITYAVRSTVIDGKSIEPGNILGMLEGKIADVDKTVKDSMFNLLNKMVDDDSSVITLFFGEGVTEEEAEELRTEIEDKFDECDVCMHFGGQPVYYYLISVE